MKKSDARRLMAKEALKVVSVVDKNAFYAGENQYDQYCIDFYYMNNQNGRMYLCSCYIANNAANCIMRIFKEV